MPKLKHWYHIYSDGKWKDPVAEHIIALKSSGLIDALDYFGIGIVGSPWSRSMVKDYIKKSGISFEVAVESNSGFEQITMNNIECSNSDKILYAHTKGGAFPSDHSSNWRRSMCVGVVLNWERAVDLLETYDAVGSHWLPEPFKHFAGTYFWVRGSYWNTLPHPVHDFSRWDAEAHIGKGQGLMYSLSDGGPSGSNWLYEKSVGQDGVPDGCVRFIVTNSIAGMEKGSVVVRALDAGIEMLLKEGHIQVLGKTVETFYDYRPKQIEAGVGVNGDRDI